MENPFPGMNPYLEHSDLWRSVHGLLIAKATEALNSTLPKKYYARNDIRTYQATERDVYPDVSVDIVRETKSVYHAGTAVADPPDAPAIAKYNFFEMREGFIEIRLSSDNKKVTVIELLSHANKAGGEGRRLYLQKQIEMMESDINFVEIDLLRRGQHTVALPAKEIEVKTSWDYLVCLSRAKNRDQFEYWAAGLRERLPRIAIPLSDDDPDQTLDLQILLNSAYIGGGFDRTTDYSGQPSPRLSASDAEWANSILQNSGLRN